jgi:LPS export ABC transporter permease LptG/LPS export ABC transporter permease LptF
MRTLDRYVIREILPPFLIALLIFTFLLALPPVMQYLENLLAKGVTWSTAARIMWTLVPQALGLTIPMALLVGILIGLGRLSADREAVALLACGVSPYRLLRPIGALAIAATAATAYVMIEAIPDANQTFREITFEEVSRRVASEVKPRVFFEDFPGWVLYARDEPEPGQPGWKDLMVADTTRGGRPRMFFAERGRLVLDRQQRTVDLVLENGTQYADVRPGESDVFRFPGAYVVGLNPDQVFPQITLQKGPNEKRIHELQADMKTKLGAGLSPHPEIMAMQQKYSIPVACIVFAIIGLALGLTVARDGKMAGFVVGIAVIFAYYVVMYLAEAHTKGYYRGIEEAKGLASASFMGARLARWWPNILLGLFGIGALVWRARYADGRLPFQLPAGATRWLAAWRRADDDGQVAATPGVARPAGSKGRTVVVIRLPYLRFPLPGLLDRYIGRTYLRIAGLAFLALLGLFYISTFIDKSDKMFKGQTDASTVLSLLFYMTPQFVYYIIPIMVLVSGLVTFGILSRTSELTVMKACGVSLYRAAVSIIFLSLAFGLVIFGLEQEVLARANRQAEIIDAEIRGRAPKVFDALNRRWVVGREGAIYNYTFYDQDRRQMNGLTIYRPRPDAWALASITATDRATYQRGWQATTGWTQDLTVHPPRWTPFTSRPLALEPPDYFESEQPLAEMLTVAQLRRYVLELSASGLNVIPLNVELQRKMAFPFVTFVMTMLAVPFGVSTGKRGTLYGIGLAIVIALSYWILMSAFVAIGKGGLLTPWLAAWAPNVIFVGAALYLFLTVKT